MENGLFVYGCTINMQIQRKILCLPLNLGQPAIFPDMFLQRMRKQHVTKLKRWGTLGVDFMFSINITLHIDWLFSVFQL